MMGISAPKYAVVLCFLFYSIPSSRNDARGKKIIHVKCTCENQMGGDHWQSGPVKGQKGPSLVNGRILQGNIHGCSCLQRHFHDFLCRHSLVSSIPWPFSSSVEFHSTCRGQFCSSRSCSHYILWGRFAFESRTCHVDCLQAERKLI